MSTVPASLPIRTARKAGPTFRVKKQRPYS